MNARLLAFDSSTETLAVAVQSGGRCHSVSGEGGAVASAQLLPRIQALLCEAGVTLTQLDAIAFGRGPGAFTGLRTACAVAQGLAFGASLPVLPIDSLLIVAEGVRAQHAAACGAALAEVDVVMDARMGEVYAAAYCHADGRWTCTREPALLSPQALNAAWAQSPPRCVAGSALAIFGDTLACGQAMRVGASIDRAAALLRLAIRQWQDGGGIDAALALPLYLRDKVALTEAERRARPSA